MSDGVKIYCTRCFDTGKMFYSPGGKHRGEPCNCKHGIAYKKELEAQAGLRVISGVESYDDVKKISVDERDTLLLAAKMAILVRLQDISKLHIPEGNALKSEIYNAIDDAFKEVK